MSTRHLIFIGAPGSGKGTQAAKLVSEYKYEQVSTGDLLRKEIAKKTELGNKVKSVMDSGNLVSDDLVTDLLNANLDLTKKNYIFDGYPRNVVQAKILTDSILNKTKYMVLYFKMDTNKLVEKITNRRVTKDGKHIYNLVTNPPRKPGICDITGEPLLQRDDDKEEVVRNRMKVYEETVGPMLDYFETQNTLMVLDADGSVDEINKQIVKKIK